MSDPLYQKKRPWEPETAVTARVAKRAVEDQFPELAPATVELLAEGWDNTVLLVNRRWLFRFPRRRVAVALLHTEFAVLPHLAGRLSIAIPRPMFWGRPSPAFPSIFLGYDRIEGIPAHSASLSARQRERLALPLAEVLRQLHAIPPGTARAWGAPPDRFRRLDFDARRSQTFERLERLRRVGLIPEVRPWTEMMEQAMPAFEPSCETLVHGDLHACQLLLDSAGGLSGIIDWGDVHLGDAAVDLALGWTFFPLRARKRFLRAYGEISESRWLIARLRALTTTVALARYAVEIRDQALSNECRQSLAHLLEW